MHNDNNNKQRCSWRWTQWEKKGLWDVHDALVTGGGETGQNIDSDVLWDVIADANLAAPIKGPHTWLDP